MLPLCGRLDDPLFCAVRATVAIARVPAREEFAVRRRNPGLFGALLLLLLPACGGPAEPETSQPEETIRFASFDFQENQILAEVYAEGVRRRGMPVSVQNGVGPREVVAPALQQGVVDVVIDYLGTALAFAQPAADDLPRDPAQMRAELAVSLAERGVEVMAIAEAEDQNGFVVTTEFSAAESVGKLSDLVELAPFLTFGGPPECADRPFCLPGLEETYGLEFGEVLSMPSRAATVEALLNGRINVGLVETTDARLAVAPIRLLIDDKDLQPPENVVPLVRTATLDRWGEELQEALDEVSTRITTNDLVQLNRAVELDGLTPAEAAARWWG
jgi:osmoprotectant transport system substrate-binding protein